MRCNYCQIEFSLIAKVEKLEEYLDYIIHKANLTLHLQKDITKYHIHPSGIHRVYTNTIVKKNDIVRKYFSSLSDKQILRIYNMYKIDFEMFGYNENEYT